MTHHPDRGGDEERFKEITTAFEVLSDEEKRQMYDEYGEEGLRDGGGGGPADAHDLFSAMFGGGGVSRGPKKGEPVVHSLRVTLEDLYKGKMSKLAIIRNRVCKTCRGRGASRPEAVETCYVCHGRGIQVTLNQIGPGMVQQVQNTCRTCKGMGETINERFRCGACKGDKVVKERKVLEVYVDKGMQHGQKITFTGEANANPGAVAGDVIVVLKQEEHDRFSRKESNLVFETEVELVDALCGLDFYIEQLDGRLLHVRSPPGQVITPGMLKSIPDEGMPIWKNPMERGFMFVKFSVKFPRYIGPSQIDALHSVFGPGTQLPPAGNAEIEEVQMIEFDQDHVKQAQANGTAYDEDDDEQHRVSCAQG
eukprot:TRINITY_DN9_c0_g1_i3.p1 TRINITY_DN9_c0_g1~~TRINITY_DN9_c0_g1_i3.p1  ORF type:complete len:366 (-),score=53.45 TRINITY_DN9_c0_g1_i3:3978-5075(-)